MTTGVRQKLPGWMYIVYTLALLPLLAYPMIFLVSFFMFDDPTANHFEQMLWFFLFNSYPFIILGAVFASYRIYWSHRNLSVGILVLLFIAYGALFVSLKL